MVSLEDFFMMSGSQFFLQFKEFELYWCAVFFLISSHFLWPFLFLVNPISSYSSDFSHAGVARGAKCE